jgi:hypothetical protein
MESLGRVGRKEGVAGLPDLVLIPSYLSTLLLSIPLSK